MVKGSYKPLAGQLQPTPQLREFFLEHFKGTKAKPIRMSGEFFDAVNTFIVKAQTGEDIDETEHRTILLKIVNAFRKVMDQKDPNIKKRRYETGFSTKRFQIMLTHSTYPVPHLPWAGISLVTMDVGVPGSDKQVIRFVSWENCFDADVEDVVVNYYGNRVNRMGAINNNLSESLVDMIFEMVAPPESFTELTPLVECMKAA